MNNPEYKDLSAEQQKKLAGFRQQIDDLDDKLIDLLIERIGIISQVGRMKRSVNPNQCPLRPGREADMVRRIVQKFEGSNFPPAAAAALWRTLIGASTAVENDLTISVYTPQHDDTLYWEAREYFGSFLNVIRQPYIKRVIGDVMDGNAAVGLLPELNSSDDTHWWTDLLRSTPNTPSIFAHIPFVFYDIPGRHRPTALAIGRIKPESTGNDVSLIAIEAGHHVSQHKLQTTFAESSLEAKWLTVHSMRPDSRHHLLEIEGFIGEENEALATIQNQLGDAILRIDCSGSYAVPLTLNSPLKEKALKTT